MPRGRNKRKQLRRIALIERRLVEVTVGEEKLYHLDKIIDQEYLNVFESETTADEEKMLMEVNKLEKLWSDDSLSRTPPDPDRS